MLDKSRFGRPVEITFQNGADSKVEIYWVDLAGDEHLYKVLAVDEAYTQTTYSAYKWKVRQMQVSEIGELAPTQEPVQHCMILNGRLQHNGTETPDPDPDPPNPDPDPAPPIPDPGPDPAPDPEPEPPDPAPDPEPDDEEVLPADLEPIVNPLKTGEFHPPVGGQMSAGMPVVFNGRFLYIANGADDEALNEVAFDLGKLEQLTADPASSAWTTVPLPEMGGDDIDVPILPLADPDPPTRARTIPASKVTPAAAVIGRRLYLFWVEEEDDEIHAAFCDATTGWSQEAIVIRYEADMVNDNDDDSNLSAYAFGDKIVLSYVSADQERLYHLLFDPTDIQEGTPYIPSTEKPSEEDLEKEIWSWTPQRVAFHDLLALDIQVDEEEGYHMSTTWFANGAGNFMVTAVYDNITSTVTTFAVPLDEEGFTAGETAAVIDLGSFAASVGVTLVRDPAGRINAFYASPDDDVIMTRTLNTYADLSAESWQVEEVFNGEGRRTAHPPAVAYVVSDTFIEEDEPRQAVYEFVIYAADEGEEEDEIQVQVRRYGTLRTVSDELALDETDVFTLYGIVDAPIPFPAANLPGVEGINREIASITYGTDTTSTARHQVSVQEMMGIKSEGKFTTGGVGGSLAASFRAGPGQTVAETAALAAGESSTTPTIVIVDEDGNDIVEPTGKLWVKQFTLVRQSFVFHDVNGRLALDAPRFQRYKTTEPNNSVKDFPTFSVVPAEIESYLPDAIARRMGDYYAAYKAGLAPGEADVFGPDYEYRSVNDNYFTNVIEPNALTLGDKNYLQIAWGAGSSMQNWKTIDATFVESSWHYDESVYGGLVAEQKFTLFGIAELGAFEFKFLTGVDVTGSTSDSSNTEEMVGIDVNLRMATLPGRDLPGAFKDYEWRVYFLPANPLWSKEYEYLQPQNGTADVVKIDPNSQPWRILFTYDA